MMLRRATIAELAFRRQQSHTAGRKAGDESVDRLVELREDLRRLTHRITAQRAYDDADAHGRAQACAGDIPDD